jgi:uncharacterized protein YndB with AHSA1/START domain
MLTLERTYPASAAEIWAAWTTKSGIESWWAPEGFAVEVQKIEVEPGGELLYTMTAVGPAQVEFMQNAGMPLTTPARKRFTELIEPTRLAYASIVDYIPGMEPYEHSTVVDITDGRVVMTMEPMHDEEWTQRLVAGRENELANLAGLFG